MCAADQPVTAADAGADAAAAPRTPVLSDVNFTVRKGQRVLVLGPNGAGEGWNMFHVHDM